MSTAEDQRIAALFEDGRQQAFQQCPGLRPIEIAGFDALDQPRTGLGEDLYVAGEAVEQGGETRALQSSGGGEDADPTVAGGRRGRLHRRLHGHQLHLRITFAQFRRSRCRRGIAGQYQSLGALLQKEITDPLAAFADVLRALLAVGHMGVVGDVEQRFGWQARTNLTQYAEPADPGIENADRGRLNRHGVARRRHRKDRDAPAIRGSACRGRPPAAGGPPAVRRNRPAA